MVGICSVGPKKQMSDINVICDISPPVSLSSQLVSLALCVTTYAKSPTLFPLLICEILSRWCSSAFFNIVTYSEALLPREPGSELQAAELGSILVKNLLQALLVVRTWPTAPLKVKP